METWRQHGYRTQVMTGVSWGHYEDYLHGRWDGTDHTDERQTDKDGKPLQHGWAAMCGTCRRVHSTADTSCDGVKRALDAGTEALYLEEPEFWVRGGYEPSFRREWKAYYGEDWRPPHESADAQYRSSKLKYYLYRRTLSQIFEFAKQYGKEHGGRDIPCYVPTHSLLNYAHWRIVSPESSLLDVGCDGYIAQVWTGTARTANVYEGVRKSRTFETAFLEYGAMQNLVRASGRKVWYLNDPIEDNLNRSWADYRANWESTLVASLLQPEVWRFEVMPWPERVFNGQYPAAEPAKPATQALALPSDSPRRPGGHPQGLRDGTAGRHPRHGRVEAAAGGGAVGGVRHARRRRAGVGHDDVPARRAEPLGPEPRLVLRPGDAAAEAGAAGRAGADRKRDGGRGSSTATRCCC